MVKNFLSVVIPVYNEEGNVRESFLEIKRVLDNLIKKDISGYEIIFVDDGSTDKTYTNLLTLKKKYGKKIRIIQFRKNFGQTPALKAGFNLAKGNLIVTLDGDLQNDPSDIPKLIQKLKEGYDVVSGWRIKRKDNFSKRIFSKIANKLRKKMIGDDLHDYGCALKIYKRECIKDLQLSGELHRYITAYLYIKGYKIGEIETNHRPRKSGKTKYNLNRGINGLMDLFFLKFWSNFSDRPLHFFGRLGLYQWILAILIFLEQIIKAIIVKGLWFGPLFALAITLLTTGLLTIIFGFLSEMMSKVYFKEEERYSIKKII
jgi:glycosyltransferase involved in cell wall biosynthesis